MTWDTAMMPAQTKLISFHRAHPAILADDATAVTPLMAVSILLVLLMYSSR